LLRLRAVIGAFREIADLAWSQIAMAGALHAGQRVADLIEIVPMARREIAIGHDRERAFDGHAGHAAVERQTLAPDHVDPAALDAFQLELVGGENGDARGHERLLFEDVDCRLSVLAAEGSRVRPSSAICCSVMERMVLRATSALPATIAPTSVSA